MGLTNLEIMRIERFVGKTNLLFLQEDGKYFLRGPHP